MTNTELPIPIEIPWKLAATSRPLAGSTPFGATVSLFTHSPPSDSLDEEYPDERLVYLKFTTSISPLSLTSLPASYIDPTGYLPVWLVLLDLRVSPDPEGPGGGIRPYFHAARPLRRTMIETGIVGTDAYEGESSDVSIGRSASQLHENVSSKVSTKSTGGGFGVPLIGGVSSRRTSTVVDSSREVDQYTENTARDASQERRELLSHTTNVENVLTLLTAEHLGSPYLRFSLRPRPLRPLSIDPADPHLWYSQLLHRRSSGVEGIQDFVTVVAVPRGQDFCVEAHLRRVFVVDIPPDPPTFGTPFEVDRVIEFLNEIYPVGTPLDELDVEASPMFTPSGDPARPIRPSVYMWYIPQQGPDAPPLNDVVNLIWNAPGRDIHTEELGYAHYKTAQEVWLDLQRTEHEEELAKSPLEDNPPFACSTRLTTCFAFPEEGEELRVKSSDEDDVGLVAVDRPDNWQLAPVDTSAFTKLRHVSIVTRWNALEHQLAEYVTNLHEFRDDRLRLDQPQVVRLFLNHWERLDPDDQRNLSLPEAADLFAIDPEYVRAIEAAGVLDLRGLAHAVNQSPRIATFNEAVSTVEPRIPKASKPAGWFGWRIGRRRPIVRPAPSEATLPSPVADAVRGNIGQALQDNIPISSGANDHDPGAEYGQGED